MIHYVQNANTYYIEGMIIKWGLKVFFEFF